MEKDLLRGAVAPLLNWYRESKRELPWRGEKDFYKILVSEIMLQQTRVEAVKEYYTAFLERFPTAEALSRASDEEVLKAWQGLGYYSRARNLKKAATAIAKKYPTTYEEVRALSGVGDYTAGALCSIALGLPYPAVDGNVLRILTRLLADGRNIDEPRTKKEFTAALSEIYPLETSEFCQALMELGAIVCLPNGAPLCEKCPWESICKAHKAGEAERYPVRKEKKARKVVELAVYILEYENEYAIEKRTEKGLLEGLWQFPNSENADLDFGEIVKKKTAKHIFTHVEWRMTGYFIKARERYSRFVWATKEELKEKYALPSAMNAFLSEIVQPQKSL